MPFAAIQLLIGVGLLLPRSARLALAASIAWALGVWYLGEGLSGLASGQASLITGAPGSALLLALLAAAAWPNRDASLEAPAWWLPLAWAVLWVGAAVFQALPYQTAGTAVSGDLTGGHIGALVAAEYLVGVGALARTTRIPAVALGLALTLVFWIQGQDLGALTTGQATDPNSGPVLALMAIALLTPGAARLALPQLRRYPQGRTWVAATDDGARMRP